MTGTSEPKFWMWPDPDKRWISEVLEHVTKNTDSGQSVTVLHCTQLPLTDQDISLTEYVVDLCFAYDLLENKTTFLSYKDHILALQLCIARLRQKEEGQFSAPSSDVLDCHKAYAAQFQDGDVDISSDSVSKAISLYKDFLKQSNCIDLWQIYSLMLCGLERNEKDLKDFIAKGNYLVLGVPQLKVSREILKLLVINKEVQHIVVEVPLDISIKDNYPDDVIQVSWQPTQIEDVFISASGYVFEKVSATKEYAENVMAAFLTLLVNSRNELALSKAMVSPLIDFTHEAFTVLKRISIQKDMPMCQTAISYVTRIKLGGKGYAPPENCPLRVHLKGLEQFVELLNQLQTIIEEDMVTNSATRRVINILKNRLLKCESHRLRQSSVEEAAANLSNTALKLVEKRNAEVASKNSSTQHGLEVLFVIHCLVNHINCSCSTSDPQAVLESSGMHRTPLNLPPLMGYFKSPEDESSCDSRSLQEEVDKNNKKFALDLSPVTISYVHSHDSSSAFRSNTITGTPLKTNFRNCLIESKRLDSQKATSSITSKEKEAASGQRTQKRSILKDISNDKGLNQSSSKLKRAKTSARSKKKQIEGQSQITKFFTFHG